MRGPSIIRWHDVPADRDQRRLRGEGRVGALGDGDSWDALAADLDIAGTARRAFDALPAEDFWALVRDCIEDHAADHPELADAAATYDLLREEFAHSCLNRLQLRNTLEMVDLADPVESLLDAGQIVNPDAAPR